MNEIISIIRTEKKYRITWIQKNILFNKLSNVMKIDGNSNKNGYRVRSLYFDSIYDDDYFDKINGLEFRKKIRLRIYSLEQSHVKLEIKQKQGASQQKKTMWISKELACEMIKGNYSGLLDLHSELGTEIYHIMERCVYRPKCIVEYNRIAFMDNTNNTRITLDSHIGTSSFCENFFSNDLFLLPVLNEPVLEIKYNNFLLSNIKQIMNIANESEISVSKYTLSRQIIG